jgi:outer membrane protein assembly factor BamE (lipoprotein component of BamABCDE complex)
MHPLKTLLLAVSVLALAGCTSAQYHRNQVSGDDKSTISVGTVQRDIKVGMTSEQVVEVLGSPNMVTTDENRNESWVYDKIATESAYSNGGMGAGIGAGGLIGATGLLGGITGSSNAGASSTSQKTLTIIIKFDANKRVRDFSYRQSKF